MPQPKPDKPHRLWCRDVREKARAEGFTQHEGDVADHNQ